MPKYIDFTDDGEKVSGKPEYLVRSRRTREVLARVVWYPPWKQWVCEFRPDTIWSQDCLADVGEFLRGLGG